MRPQRDATRDASEALNFSVFSGVYWVERATGIEPSERVAVTN